MKIAVACGGDSSERVISIKSGKAVHAALELAGHQSFLFDVNPKTFSAGDLPNADLVFIALHGEYGEDGKFQTVLQSAGIPYTGSGPEACRLAMDKLAFREALTRQNLPMPRLITCGTKDQIDTTNVPYPVFIKPAIGGSSIGVSKARDGEQLISGVECAFRESDRIVIEKAVSGREFAVGVLNDKALQPIEICTDRDYFDYEAKYNDPGTRYLFPENLSEGVVTAMKKLALQTHVALGCEVLSRVDLILQEDKIYILELNAIPGMTERSLLPLEAKYDGIQFPELCDIIVKQTVKQHNSLKT